MCPLSNISTLHIDPKYRLKVEKIILDCLHSVNPSGLMSNFIKRNNSILTIKDKTIDLHIFENILMISIGKASIPMGHSLITILGPNLTRGIIVTRDLPIDFDDSNEKIQYIQGGHPTPNNGSLLAAKNVVNLLKETNQRDLIFFIISGGGSSLIVSPANSISLSEIKATTQALFICGAAIHEINVIRKHIDLIKGGNLAKIACRAKVFTIVLSDVIGDDLDIIGSGPTIGDPSTFSDAMAVLEKYKINNIIPNNVKEYISKGITGDVPETPKPNDPCFHNVDHIIVGNNSTAATAALNSAISMGFNTIVLSTFISGEARVMGEFIASIARQIHHTNQPLRRPACVIFGGETTVSIKGKGKGGRNLETALSAVKDLSGIPNCCLVTIATDGIDGNTDVAGAFVTGETYIRGKEINIVPDYYLQNNDSYNYFNFLKDLLITGPTYTNVNDISILFLF